MIAIIPARGGSKGLPNKNIKKLLGKPMLAYTIEAAKKSKYITEIIISTDSTLIAEIAVSYGASCPFMRPLELASDSALAIDNYRYTVKKLNHEYGYNIDDFIVLQPTSPLRNNNDIDEAITLFKDKKADSVISYVEEDHPVIWHKYLTPENKFENIFDDSLSNRQDNKKSYYPNGAIFIFNINLIKDKQYYSDNSYAYIMPKNRSIDVDYLEDFEYAEYLLRKEQDE